MTQLKTGDRVVPGRFEKDDLITWNVDHLRLIDKECIVVELNKLYGTYRVSDNPIDGSSAWFPAYALTPVKPKWEPVVGERYRKINGRIIKRYIGYDTELEAHVFYNEDSLGYESCNIEFLRPIAPSIEEELNQLICDHIGKRLPGLADSIIGLFNRHKEGEGR